jgi:Helicase associated domain
VKKVCKISGCTRLVVKAGFCSRHFNNKDAPVKQEPPFSFNADARWDELFPQLEEFAKKNGHARVPTSDRSSDLARFVVHIRSVYRNKKAKTIKKDPDADPNNVVPDLTQSTLLTPERMDDLNSIGFEFQLWSVDSMQWENRFQELMQHKKDHGTFHVTSKQNPTLSSWCKTQRQRYKNTMVRTKSNTT